MLNILYIEDEVDFREQLKERLSSHLRISDIDVEKFSTKPQAGETAVQFQRWLLGIVGDVSSIDGVILDSDLSGYGNGISKETLLAVFRAMGVPVCRYSKRTRGTTSERLKHLATIASEGAASILVPSDLIDGLAEYTREDDHLAIWLKAVFNGFSSIKEAYSSLSPVEGNVNSSPPSVLAKILENPNLELDFLGYTGASLFFFGDYVVEDDGEQTDEILATNVKGVSAAKLGYWLYNYIIAFPGPILNMPAAAAFMGVKSVDLDPVAFAKAMAQERYIGPFDACLPLFSKEKLEGAMIEQGITGVELLRNRGVACDPIYVDDPARQGVYCIATNISMTSDEGVGPIDFIPGGASDLCRVSRKIYQRWIPWLNL